MPADVRELLAFGRDLQRSGARARIKLGQLVDKTTADGQRIAQQNAPVDTGAHRAGIISEVHHDGLRGFHWGEWGPTSDYGAHLEFGTYKMSPQPHIVPSLDAVAPGFVRAAEMIAGEVV